MKRGSGLLLVAAAACLVACHARPCFAVQVHEWEILKDDYFYKLANDMKNLAGQGWLSRLHYADRISGWDGTTLARMVKLENAGLRVKPLQPAADSQTDAPRDLPATFTILLADIRETLASESRLSLKSTADKSAEPDTFLGSDDSYFWFTSPGNYAAAFPDEWRALLGKLRENYGLAPQKDGLQCTVDINKNIFAANEPIDATVRVRNTSGKAIADPPALDPASLTVTAADGTPVPPVRTVWQIESTASIKPWDELAKAVDLKRSYALRKPGKFTLKFRYKLGEAVVESPEETVRIVPDDTFMLGLKRAGKAGTGKRGEQMLFEVVIGKAYEQPDELTNLTVRFHADPVGGGFASGLAGIPGDDSESPRKVQEVVPKTLQLGKGTSAFIYDLGLVKWRRAIGTQVQSSTLWDFAPMGEQWDIRAELLGRAGGDWFRITSRAVRVRVLRDAQGK